MSSKSVVIVCCSFLLCLIFGAEAIGRRAFRNIQDGELAKDAKSKHSFGRLGSPCALAGEKCFDKQSMCADVGAGKRDVCQCKEDYSLVEGKCRANPASEDNVTAASFGGCPYASMLAQQHNEQAELAASMASM